MTASTSPLLSVQNLVGAYGKNRVLHGVSLEVHPGEVVAVLGPNGAGKTTLLRCISGLLAPVEGNILVDNRSISGLRPVEIVRLGVSQVPEGRQVFSSMTVGENLLLGGYSRRQAELAPDLESILDLFPVLRRRFKQPGGLLSGGEQQMLVIGRALMAAPRLLLLDEPSLGLAPKIVDGILEMVKQLRDRGISTLLVEQNARASLAMVDRAYVMETGHIVLSDTGSQMAENPEVQAAYLGHGFSVYREIKLRKAGVPT